MSEKAKHIFSNLRRASIYHGVYARVARKTGVTVPHVRFVALGLRHSDRIEKELIREIKRVEREAAEKESAA